MRTVTETFEVYTFTELNDKAKDKVRGFYGDCREACFFTDDCERYLKDILPNSELKVYYSLGYCQSDYFTLNGDISLSDVLDKVADRFFKKDIKYLCWFIKEWCGGFTIQGMGRNDYFYRESVNFACDIIYDMERDELREIRYELINDFEDCVYSYLDDLCNELKEDGYAYFYEYDDEDIEVWCDCNEFEFYANGERYA